MKKSVIITGAGIGKRMGSSLPKQFLRVNAKPIIMHTVEKFYNYDKDLEIVITLPEDYLETWEKLCLELNFTIPHRVVTGGKERFDSIKAALAHTHGEVIAVHDAVRPAVSLDVIDRCFQTAEKKGAAVPFLEIVDTLRQKIGAKTQVVNRGEYLRIQTPQVFHREFLEKAYSGIIPAQTTDDASLVESCGYELTFVEGNVENIKVTTPADLALIAYYLQEK